MGMDGMHDGMDEMDGVDEDGMGGGWGWDEEKEEEEEGGWD